MGFGSITGSGVLAGFALVLGANNLQIGLLAAIPFMTMPLQILTVGLVERFGVRKKIAVPLWFLAEVVWIPIAMIPLYAEVPGSSAVSILLGLVFIRGIAAALQNAAWNSWIRDLIPQHVLGSFFARRLRYATLAAMGFGLGAAFFIDYWKGQTDGSDQAFGYTIALVFGAVFLGMLSPFARSMMPEPLMQRQPGQSQGLLRQLAEPFKDPDYRGLLRFMFLWNFALNMAVPFFAVYLLQRVGLPLSAVMGFTLLSQAVNVMFLGAWGPMTDRLGNRAVLSVAASLYLLVILGWTFTTMPERWALTIPLLIVLHMLAGAAASGATLTTGTLGLKVAPEGKATQYLAATSIVANLGAGLGPLVGGQFADYFESRSLRLDFTWVDPSGISTLPALNLTGFDFLFGVAFLIGLVALGSLSSIKEKGVMSREVVLDELMAPMQRLTRPMSTVPGIGFITQFPYGFLRHIPGFDAAVGVTGYQIAESARVAAAGASTGQRASIRVAAAVEHVMTDIWEASSKVEQHAEELARHTTRGAIHAAAEVSRDISEIAGDAASGVMRSLDRLGDADAESVAFGIGYGTWVGATESGEDPEVAIASAVESASKVAEELGLDVDAVAAEIASGAETAAMAHDDDKGVASPGEAAGR
jgi:MFS family permease